MYIYTFVYYKQRKLNPPLLNNTTGILLEEQFQILQP